MPATGNTATTTAFSQPSFWVTCSWPARRAAQGGLSNPPRAWQGLFYWAPLLFKQT